MIDSALGLDPAGHERGGQGEAHPARPRRSLRHHLRRQDQGRAQRPTPPTATATGSTESCSRPSRSGRKVMARRGRAGSPQPSRRGRSPHRAPPRSPPGGSPRPLRPPRLPRRRSLHGTATAHRSRPRPPRLRRPSRAGPAWLNGMTERASGRRMSRAKRQRRSANGSTQEALEGSRSPSPR